MQQVPAVLNVGICSTVDLEAEAGAPLTRCKWLTTLFQNVDTQGGMGVPVPDNFFATTGRFNQGNQMQLSDVLRRALSSEQRDNRSFG